MEFGTEIKEDRPTWLDVSESIWVKWSEPEGWSGNKGMAAGPQMHSPWIAFRLPANHPHYNLTTHTYTVRPEDEAALLASDPLSRPTPDERAVTPELVERMEAYIREYLKTFPDGAFATEARSIVAALEPHIELAEARKIAKGWLIYDDADSLQATEPAMKAILNAIRRGRQLEKEGK